MLLRELFDFETDRPSAKEWVEKYWQGGTTDFMLSFSETANVGSGGCGWPHGLAVVERNFRFGRAEGGLPGIIVRPWGAGLSRCSVE